MLLHIFAPRKHITDTSVILRYYQNCGDVEVRQKTSLALIAIRCAPLNAYCFSLSLSIQPVVTVFPLIPALCLMLVDFVNLLVYSYYIIVITNGSLQKLKSVH